MIEWDNSYSIHNAHIDAQHKQLFDLAKQAYVMLNRRVTPEEIREMLLGFFNYIKEHFHDEEQYMEKIGYPNLEEHRKIHNEITKSLVTLIKNVKNVPQITCSLVKSFSISGNSPSSFSSTNFIS